MIFLPPRLFMPVMWWISGFDPQPCSWRHRHEHGLTKSLRAIEFLSSVQRLTLETITNWGLGIKEGGLGKCELR